MQTDLCPKKAKVFIENLCYLEPDVFHPDKDLLKELQLRVGIVLLSPNRICIECGSSLLVKADRPSRVTVHRRNCAR